MKRSGVNQSLRLKILNRDNHRCMKCGRSKPLQIHHIIPAYLGGTDEEFNLITLCKYCHDLAPDNPTNFIKFCSYHLPSDLERSKNLTKTFIQIIIFNKEYDKINNPKDKLNYINNKTEELYKDFWNVYVSNDINQFSHFYENHLKDFKNVEE